MGDLADSLTLQHAAANNWTCLADPRYMGAQSMFGGWTAAILLKSVLDDDKAQGTPAALTAHYLKAVTPNTEHNIRTRFVGGGRSLSFWQAELWPLGAEEPAVIAVIVLANRRDSDRFVECVMPEAPDPDSLPSVHPPGTFGERTVHRPVLGFPWSNQPGTRSISWVREMTGRSMDYLQLTFLADAYAPRVFQISSGPRPSSTLTLSVYYHATSPELNAIGDDYVLNEAIGTRAEQSTAGQQARLWSRSGALLATTEQLHWFK